MERKHLVGEQMAERGWMGVREEVERRTGTAGEQRGRSEGEKETGKQINQMKWKQLEVQVGEGNRSRRVLNRLDKELRCDTLIFSFTI